MSQLKSILLILFFGLKCHLSAFTYVLLIPLCSFNASDSLSAVPVKFSSFGEILSYFLVVGGTLAIGCQLGEALNTWMSSPIPFLIKEISPLVTQLRNEMKLSKSKVLDL